MEHFFHVSTWGHVEIELQLGKSVIWNFQDSFLYNIENRKTKQIRSTKVEQKIFFPGIRGTFVHSILWHRKKTSRHWNDWTGCGFMVNFFSFSLSRLVQQKRIATRNKNCFIRCCEIKKKYNQNVHKPIWRCIESEMKDKFHSFMQFNCTVFCTNIVYTVKKPNREMWISVMQRTVWKLSSFCHHQTDHIALNISFKLTITMAWIAARKWRTKIEKK